MPLISIEVTPDVAEKIRFMAESGVFSLQSGNCSLNFKEGQLRSIKTEIFTYAQDLSTVSTSSPLDLNSAAIKVMGHLA